MTGKATGAVETEACLSITPSSWFHCEVTGDRCSRDCGTMASWNGLRLWDYGVLEWVDGDEESGEQT